METPLQTKSVNALFAFLKTTLLTVEQMTAGFFSSKTTTRLSLIPIMEGNLNLSNSTNRPLNSYFSMALLLLGLFFAGNAFGQTLGDYRSNNSSMNWSSTSNWQRWNGSTWQSNPSQGYPGLNSGTGVVTIQNTNTVTIDVNPANAIGSLIVGVSGSNSATLNFDRNGAISLDITGSVAVNDGSFNIPGRGGNQNYTMTIGGNLTVGTGNTFDMVGGDDECDITFNGTNQIISGAGTFTEFNDITFTNSGTKTISNALPTVRGILTVDAGTVLSLGAAVGATIAPSNLAIQCGATTGSSITGSGILTLGGNVTVTDAGTGTSGATIAAPLALGSTRTFTVADDGTTALDLSISAIVSGSAGITKDGAGTMDLSAANNYNGTTTLTAGNLRASNTVVSATAGAFGNSASATNNIILNGGTIQSNTATFSKTITIATTNSGLDAFGAARTISSTISRNATGTVNLNIGGTFVASAEGQDLTLSGTINNTTGTLGLTKIGSSTVILSGSNSYGGTTTVTDGILRANSDVIASSNGAFGNTSSSSATILNGGTIQSNTTTFSRGVVVTATNSTVDAYGSARTISSSINVSNGNTYTLNVGGITAASAEGQTLTLSNTINNSSGTLGLTKIGTSTVILSSSSNAYTGLTTVSDGTLQYGTNNMIATGAVTVSGGTLSMLTFTDTVGAVTLTSGAITGTTGALTAASYALESGTISKILAGTGGLTKSTSGTVTLSGANTYTGTNTISAGTLSINSTTALGAVANNLAIANLAVANVAANVTVGNLTLGGAGTASGTWGFTGSGATYINATYFTSTAGVITVTNNTAITPTVTVTPIGTYTYSGASQGPNAATNTGSGTSYSFSYSGTGYGPTSALPTDAGNYTVTATVAAVPGFYNANSSSATAFSIAKKALTIGAPTIASKIYDGNTIAGAVTEGAISGLIGIQTVIATGTAANYSSASAGTYTGVVVSYILTDGINGGLATNYSLANGTATGVITAGPFAKMQILLPGETAAPGTPSGKTGTPNSQVSGVAFTANVHAVDAFWNIVTSAPANTIAITTSDINDVHPATNTLSSGTRTFSITLKTVGSSTVTATNVSDGTKTAYTSPSVTVTPGIKTTAQDGDWNNASTWSPSGVPYFSDQVYIVGSDDVIVTANATCASINFTDENSSLSVNSGIILTVTGSVTLDSYTDNTDTSAEILGDGTLNAGSLNVGLASILNNTDGSDNTLNITIDTMNISGDITMYNNDEGGGDANRPGLYINSPSVLSASKVAMIQTGNGGGGSRIITFDVDNGATVNLSGGPNPITISSEVDLDSDHVDFDFDTSSTINFNGIVAQNIPASISNSRVGGSTDNPVIVNYGNLTITNTTGTTTSAATGRTVNVKGNWTNNGLFTATSSTVNFIGNANEAIAGTTVTTFDDVTIGKTGGTLSVNTNATVGDDLTFTTTVGTLSIASPRILTVTDVITVNTNTGGNSVACTISGTGTLNTGSVLVGTLPGDINSGSSAYTTTLTSTIADFTIANDIDLNSYRGSGNRRSNAVFNHSSGTINLDGAVVITNQHANNTSTFSMATGAQAGVLNLANATPFSLSLVGISTVNLNGTSAVVEYLGSVPQTALGTTYRTLKINNSNTGVTLSGNATATTLDLTDGLVTTGANTLTVASGGSIVNASSNSYVNGKLARVLTTTSTTTYPVGKGGVYSPVDFTYVAAPGTKTVTMEQFETGTPFSSAASLATFGSRYWNVTHSATGVAYRVGLNDGGNTAPSGSSVVILRRDNGTISTNASSYSSPNYTNVTSFANTSGIFTNEVALGVNNIPLSITGVSGINTKIYNGNTIATAIGTPTLSGSISPGDVVTLSGTAVYTFDTKNIGTSKAVTVSGLTLSGANASGYSLPTDQIPGLTGDITVRPIEVTANTNTKTFDNFATSATLPSLTSGALQGTDTFGFIQTYDNKNAGTNKTLTPSGIVNDGNSGNNYAVTFVANNTGVINAKTLTIATPTTIDKVYDGTNVAATTSGSWALTGVISPNDVILNKSAVFASKNFGTWGITSTSTLSGADAGNYILIQPILFARTISRLALTITANSEDKFYDTTSTAFLTGGVLNGILLGDDVTLVLAGNYGSRAAGGPYTMTPTCSITGTDIGNYTFTQPTLTPRSIIPVTLTIVGATTADKAYNGLTTATVTGGTLVGVVPGDSVSLVQSGNYPSKNVGGPYSITPNFSINGIPIANYILTQPVLNDASITPKVLTISGNSQNKVYDGTSTATLSGVGAGSLVGVVAGETINLNLILNYYSSPGVTVKDAGGTYAVTSTSTIASGDINTDLANYSLSQPTLTVRSITKIALTITGTTTVDKVYDRTNTALLTDGVLNGVLSGEDVSLILSGRYASSNAGGPYTMTSTSTLIGLDIANYTLVQPSNLTQRSISKVTLTIDGATSIDKDYDGNTNSIVIGSSLVGIVPGDAISLTQAGIYPTKNVGGPYSIVPNFSISGAAAINYDLIQSPLADATINSKTLTIIGTTQNKMYDGTDTATLIGGGLSGVVSGEDVVLNFVANYSSKDAGGPYTITSNSSISGSDIGNYTFIQPSVLTPARSIIKIPLTVTGVTTSDKVYDGNRTATINTAAAVLNGTVLFGETVTLNTIGATANFDTRDVGVGKTVTGANFILDGADAINYTAIQPTMTADITARTLTITANNISKCAESTYNFTGIEFTRDYIVPGDVASVTLTSAGADMSAIQGTYPITISDAIGTGIDNYDIVYIPGNLVVNPLPNATMTNDIVNCLNQTAKITFTGFNGTGIEKYKFYYTIDGTPYTVSTLPGNNTVTVNVPSNAVRSFVYVLTDVEDENTSCSKVISGASITVSINLCTQLRPMQCGQTLRWLNEVIQSTPVHGATKYRFNLVRTDNPADNRTVTVNSYLFNYAQLPGGLMYGKTYNVRVSLFIGSWLSPGPVCTLTAPSEPLCCTLTKVRDFQCGATLLFMTDVVEALPVYKATTYEFEVTSGAGTFVKSSANHTFSLYYSVPGRALYGTPYSIRVRSKGDATAFTAWGDPCVVTTPMSRMSDKIESDSIFNVKAFPNPFASNFSLDIESSSDAQVELKVYDMIGRQLEVRKATVSELSVLELGRNYPSGVYNVVVSQGDRVKSIRMVKR